VIEISNAVDLEVAECVNKATVNNLFDSLTWAVFVLNGHDFKSSSLSVHSYKL
jgi:hypothetical protein